VDLLDVALSYAALGWPVFPCQPGAKVPAVKRGFHDASVDPEDLTAWWEYEPSFNIGIATGPAGLLVVDLDVKLDLHLEEVNGHPELVEGPNYVNGLLTFSETLTTRDLPWLDTHEVNTPSGGIHLYFAVETPVPSSAGRVGRGVDIRSDGGYVIAAGSSTDAGCYELERNCDPLPAPQWLVELATRSPGGTSGPVPGLAGTSPARLAGHSGSPGGRYAQAALEAEVAAVRSAVDGTRNDQLCRSAFSLGQLAADGQLAAGVAVASLLEAALAAGLTEREAERTIASGLGAGFQHPRRTTPQ